MKNTIIKFGIFSALIMVGGMSLVMFFSDDIGFDRGAIFGYTTMILSFLMVFFGVRSYREKMNGGEITFGKAFKIGALIALISCVAYVLSWLVMYYAFMPDFFDKYAAAMIEKAKAAHASQQEIDATVKSMTDMKEMCKNPLINAAFTFIEPAPVAIVMSLISALILRKKKQAATA